MVKKNAVEKKVIVKQKTKTVKISKKVSVFARTLNKSQEWIKEMHHELKWMTGDSLYHLLRAVLHSLREQLTINEAAHFSAQLPLLLRGTFYEGWDPQSNLRNAANRDDFLQIVKNKMSPVGIPNFDLEQGVSTALSVIKKHISSGEMEDLVGMLNPSLKNFIQKVNSHKEASL